MALRLKIRRKKTWAAIGTLGTVAIAAFGLFKYYVGPHTPEYKDARELQKDTVVMERALRQYKSKPVAEKETATVDSSAKEADTADSVQEISIAELKQRMIDSLTRNFDEQGLEYLKALLRENNGLFKLQLALSDAGFFEYLKGMFQDEGYSLIAPFFNGEKEVSPLLDIVADRELRGKLATLMKTKEGQDFIRQLVMSTEGDHLLGRLFNNKGGPLLALDLVSTEEGMETLRSALEGMTYADPIRDPPELNEFEPTDLGYKFRLVFDSEEQTIGFIDAIGNEETREEYVRLFTENTDEARTILREAMSTEEGRTRLIRMIVSENGQKFIERLGEEGVGQPIGGDDLWLSQEGRTVVRELLKTREGTTALLKLVSGFEIVAEALSEALSKR